MIPISATARPPASHLVPVGCEARCGAFAVIRTTGEGAAGQGAVIGWGEVERSAARGSVADEIARTPGAVGEKATEEEADAQVLIDRRAGPGHVTGLIITICVGLARGVAMSARVLALGADALFTLDRLLTVLSRLFCPWGCEVHTEVTQSLVDRLVHLGRFPVGLAVCHIRERLISRGGVTRDARIALRRCLRATAE